MFALYLHKLGNRACIHMRQKRFEFTDEWHVIMLKVIIIIAMIIIFNKGDNTNTWQCKIWQLFLLNCVQEFLSHAMKCDVNWYRECIIVHFSSFKCRRFSSTVASTNTDSMYTLYDFCSESHAYALCCINIHEHYALRPGHTTHSMLWLRVFSAGNDPGCILSISDRGS